MIDYYNLDLGVIRFYFKKFNFCATLCKNKKNPLSSDIDEL